MAYLIDIIDIFKNSQSLFHLNAVYNYLIQK